MPRHFPRSGIPHIPTDFTPLQCRPVYPSTCMTQYGAPTPEHSHLDPEVLRHPCYMRVSRSQVLPWLSWWVWGCVINYPATCKSPGLRGVRLESELVPGSMGGATGVVESSSSLLASSRTLLASAGRGCESKMIRRSCWFGGIWRRGVFLPTVSSRM